MAKKKYFYPLPKPVVEKYTKSIFEPIKLGECVTSIWVGSAGRRVVNKFIIGNINLFADILPNSSKYLLVYIEPLDLTEESLAGYLRLIGSSFLEVCQTRKDCKNHIDEKETEIFDDEGASYSKLLRALRSLIAQVISAGYEVVLFLGEFDELEFVDRMFCNNLRSLWNRFESKLHYVFLIKEVKMVFEKGKVGEDLGENFLQNIVYMPVSNENSDYLIGRLSERISYEVQAREKEILKEMCDGHPYFLKVACNVLVKKNRHKKLAKNELIKLLRYNHELRAVAQRIIDVQTKEAREALKKIAMGKIENLPSEEAKTIELLGLVEKSKDGYYRPFCQLFFDAVLKRAMPSLAIKDIGEELFFDPKAGALLFRGRPIEEKFTRQEYEVLVFLMKEPGKLRTRDEISETLWGKESYEKYSNWAIDQLMSKLRKKLDKLGIKKDVLVTVRGRGYKFIG